VILIFCTSSLLTRPQTKRGNLRSLVHASTPLEKAKCPSNARVTRQPAPCTWDLDFSVMISSTLPTLDSRPQEGVLLAREAHLLPFLVEEEEADSVTEEAKEEAAREAVRTKLGLNSGTKNSNTCRRNAP